MKVILCGDLFQLPPINDEGYPESSFAYKSDSWEELDLKICYLDEQHRQWDEHYLRVLNDIRTKDVSESTFEKLASRVNGKIANDVYPTKLYTHNKDVNAINNFELELLPGEAKTYQMAETGNADLVEQLTRGCLAPQVLNLKVGAKVMFVKNNPGSGYMNGTVGEVIEIDEDYPVVLTKSGDEIIVQPESWEIRDPRDETKIMAAISQIPLRLAWAITIHKSQGMSLDMAEINLSGAFAYGMGYVALSRVRSLSGLNLTGINEIALQVDPEIIELDRVWQKMSLAFETTLKEFLLL